MSMSNWILVDQQLDWLEMHSLGYLLRNVTAALKCIEIHFQLTNKTWLAVQYVMFRTKQRKTPHV